MESALVSVTQIGDVRVVYGPSFTQVAARRRSSPWDHDLCKAVAGARLERVCRYALRPPVSDERLRLGADGQLVLRLRHPWADGTTDLAFAPTAFLARLAVLVPRPRVNLVLDHGVLAPRAAWRAPMCPVP